MLKVKEKNVTAGEAIARTLADRGPMRRVTILDLTVALELGLMAAVGSWLALFSTLLGCPEATILLSGGALFMAVAGAMGMIAPDRSEARCVLALIGIIGMMAGCGLRGSS
jgi:hypothetical protein